MNESAIVVRAFSLRRKQAESLHRNSCRYIGKSRAGRPCHVPETRYRR
jgi:hypothetical protein